jgi:hypothetical protein
MPGFASANGYTAGKHYSTNEMDFVVRRRCPGNFADLLLMQMRRPAQRFSSAFHEWRDRFFL